MKRTLFLVVLALTQLTYADTIREERIRQEMIERVDGLIVESELARTYLKDKDAVEACVSIKKLFALYPDHLKAVGSHLDLFKGRTVKVKDQALRHLIFIHRKSIECDRGVDSEYIDPKQLSKELKNLEKDLKKHKKVIRRTDTDKENQFYYEYEF